MSTFKDMISRDRDIVLNPDELGEIHDIDGKDTVCVICDAVLGETQGGIDFPFAKSHKTIFAKCEEMPRKKGYGAELMVDGVPYIVQSWNESMGMAQIVIAITFNS